MIVKSKTDASTSTGILRRSVFAAFRPFLFRATYCLLFLIGCLTAPVATGILNTILVFLIIFVVAPILGLSALMASFAALVGASARIYRWPRQEKGAEVLGLALFPVLAALFWALGFFVILVAQSAYFAAIVSRNIAAIQSGSAIADDGFELISTDPQVAAYRIHSSPGFAAPGFTHYFVLDRSGQLNDLAKTCDIRELAATPDVRARPYRIYAISSTSYHLGPYSYASVYDVDDCPDKR
jgi:hypothetical protein